MQLSQALRLAPALAALGVPHSAAAQPTVEADLRGGLYQDSDDTTIVTSAVAARAWPHEHFSISGRYLADVVTTASVDVVAAATGRWDEVRHEGTGGLGYKDDDRSASGSYIYSVEDDWRSHTGTLSFSHDTLDHQLTVGLSGSFVYNEVGRAEDTTFDERLLGGSANAEVTIVATKSDLIGFVYSFGYMSGYQASPYRFVRFAGPLPGAEIAVPERHPDTRIRHAVGARWNHHVERDMALRTDARAYADDWGVASGTLGVDYVIGIGVFEIGILTRGYLQKAATFYREIYDAELAFMTADRELSTFFDVAGGARVGFDVRDAGPFESIRADVVGKAFYYHFFDYLALPERYGVVASAGFGATL
jgi:hypothetical protein